jgi:lysophospholipase L1-like esterase
MKISIKLTLVFLLFFATAANGPAQTKTTALLEEFEFHGQKYSIAAYFLPPRAGLTLKKNRTSKNLSAGLDGENIYLGTRISSDNFYVFWLNYRNSIIRLALYEFQRNRSQVLALAGFSFIGLPEIIEENGDLRALVFLGNRSDNDDIFYYEPELNSLTPLTQTPFSEKGFSMLEKDGQLEIETSSLRAKYRSRFDPRLRKSILLEEKYFPAKQKKNAGNADTATPKYYNTYIGFGDSITWGKIEGVQRLDLCYLTKMGEILAGTYGPAWSINLGVPADQTYEGAQRVEEELDTYPAFYFLLMLGVNDVWRTSFSLASSLESLEFIIDAAQARDMRVIASTLTPRKDTFSQYKYYWDQLRALSAGIIALAKKKGAAYIDTLSAFMNTDPPNGWKTLLESDITAKGNHPNAQGHMLIASLFAPVLVAFPPLPPSGISVLNPQDNFKKNVQWDVNYESDFSHFAIEFAYKPDSLSQHLTTVNSNFTFTLFPFLPQLYFRLQTVDQGNRASAFSTIFPAQTGDYSRTKQCLQHNQ